LLLNLKPSFHLQYSHDFPITILSIRSHSINSASSFSKFKFLLLHHILVHLIETEKNEAKFITLLSQTFSTRTNFVIKFSYSESKKLKMDISMLAANDFIFYIANCIIFLDVRIKGFFSFILRLIFRYFQLLNYPESKRKLCKCKFYHRCS